MVYVVFYVKSWSVHHRDAVAVIIRHTLVIIKAAQMVFKF